MLISGRARQRWLVVIAFAIGMAWVESASVYYLRLLVDRVQPYQNNPLPVRGELGAVELAREAATMVMLLTVGMLAAHTWLKRLAYSAIAFGVWDIFYYVFLRIMSGWPQSLLDWDVLFLIPLPWWGPVLAPVSIAALMIVWGTLVTQLDESFAIWPQTWKACGLSCAGILLALYVFMSDAVRAVGQGLDVTTMPLPQSFNWGLFGVAFALMAAPIFEIGWRMRSRGERLPEADCAT